MSELPAFDFRVGNWRRHVCRDCRGAIRSEAQGVPSFAGAQARVSMSRTRDGSWLPNDPSRWYACAHDSNVVAELVNCRLWRKAIPACDMRCSDFLEQRRRPADAIPLLGHSSRRLDAATGSRRGTSEELRSSRCLHADDMPYHGPW